MATGSPESELDGPASITSLVFVPHVRPAGGVDVGSALFIALSVESPLRALFPPFPPATIQNLTPERQHTVQDFKPDFKPCMYKTMMRLSPFAASSALVTRQNTLRSRPAPICAYNERVAGAPGTVASGLGAWSATIVPLVLTTLRATTLWADYTCRKNPKALITCSRSFQCYRSTQRPTSIFKEYERPGTERIWLPCFKPGRMLTRPDP